MSRKPLLKIKQRPAPVRNVHELAELMAGIIEDAREIQFQAEACGSGLYNVMSPELCMALESHKAEGYCDVD